MNRQERIAWLERELEDLRKRWPAHSLKPEMFDQLEELEEELDRLRREEKSDSAAGRDKNVSK